MKTLRLILGDQLSQSISSLKDYNPDTDIILMCEVWNEATYVKHHKKKIAFLFSAMRHFAEALKKQDFNIEYTELDASANSGSFSGEVKRMLSKYSFDRIVVTHPGEYRVLEELQSLENELNIAIEIREDDRFLCTPDEFANWAKDRKQLRMEYFYREMRKTYDILMDGKDPLGGQWNYDAENRKPPKDGLTIPPPYIGKPDDITQDCISLVSERFDTYFGDVEPFYFAVTRADALQVLDQFIAQRLPHFGDYQDAMIEGEPWMYHSHISFYLNCGLLLPLECVQAAEKAYHAGQAPLNAVEGFIRQIIGWREYVRGIYWLKMPDYAEQNFFEAQRPLPDFYWTANTKMNCLRQCVLETKQNAYAHHIQRLMVLGNFALLAGIDPKDVNEWFLIVYADAYEWVELPNVSGMILFADGGYLASKPYAAGGSYINKMSDYCKNCSYKVTKKNGPDACPFNYLYWNFLDRNREKLSSNHRIGMMYKTFERMGEDKQKAIHHDSQEFFRKIDKTYSSDITQPYHICVIDIGSPKLGNLGWCLFDIKKNQELTGDNLDDLFPNLMEASKTSGIILGLEAPLFAPLRPDLMEATRARKGEGRRPWSAGAGAQVLTMNLPIMTYIFKHLYALKPDISYFLNEHGFSAQPGQMMIFEALVSGADKGASHINDAQIMVSSCLPFSQLKRLPQSILEEENQTEYLNLSAAALLRCGIWSDPTSLCLASPIYKPSNDRI